MFHLHLMLNSFLTHALTHTQTPSPPPLFHILYSLSSFFPASYITDIMKTNDSTISYWQYSTNMLLPAFLEWTIMYILNSFKALKAGFFLDIGDEHSQLFRLQEQWCWLCACHAAVLHVQNYHSKTVFPTTPPPLKTPQNPFFFFFQISTTTHIL